MKYLKDWMDRKEMPSDFYQLLDKPCLFPNQGELLEAIRLATRFLHPYQNHKDPDCRQRARTLQLLAAKAERTFSDRITWEAYDQELLGKLGEQFRNRFLGPTAKPTHQEVETWLREQQGIAVERLDDVIRRVMRVETIDSRTPSSTHHEAETAVDTVPSPLLSVSSPPANVEMTQVPFLGIPPFTLGNYEVLERLGMGGIGVVYKARHSQLKKLVAIKLLRPERPPDAKTAARFRREIQAIGQLDHPHIVRATDAGEFQGTHFLVMELLDGQNLHDLVRSRGPLPVHEACQWIRQAAFGLQYAHEMGLIHRDIKPSNLMLTSHGILKILDLGLALLCPTLDSVEALTRAEDATASGVILGTIDYIAPEQLNKRQPIDGRADLYSLGCTLFFLLTGRAPFHDEDSNLLQRLMAHGSQPVPRLSQLRPDFPVALDQVLARLMAKAPQDRFSSASEVAKALESLANSVESWPTIPPLVQNSPAIPLQPPSTPTSTATPVARPPAKPPVTSVPKRADRPPPPPLGGPPHTARTNRSVLPPVVPGRLSGSNPVLTMLPESGASTRLVQSPGPPRLVRLNTSSTIIWWITGGVLLLCLIGIVWMLATGLGRDTRKSRSSPKPEAQSMETSPDNHSTVPLERDGKTD